MWFSLKYLFWPGFRRRYEETFTTLLRRRQARVQAQLQEKLNDQLKLNEHARELQKGAVARGIDLLRQTDAQAETMLAAQAEQSVARAQQLLDELRPLLVRDQHLDMLAKGEEAIKRQQAALNSSRK